ncbi:metabotropic glutamate receptor-like isoform X1 [Saccostrea cucullata]|uniref:metabotropic glutamate receptor-like isoform X1 n=1 Tax=Saccostrea cuccullata TaxID=36930 RepID=UPI002ED27003
MMGMNFPLWTFMVEKIFVIFCVHLLRVCAENQALSAYIPGDIIIGGLFPIHQKSSGDRRACGEINLDRGVQRAEAMLHTIDNINKNPEILPKIKLGAKIYDTCARGTFALERSLEFIRGSFTSIDSSDFSCDDGSKARANVTYENVAGVIGGSYSSVSIQVANLLRLFKLPQISYASTSADLSDKARYDYFSRTVPPDNFQAKAIVDIVEYFNWTYVSTVASEGDYGQSGIDEFKEKAKARNVCIAESIKILSNSNPSTFDDAIIKLKAKENARIVVLFLRIEDATNLLNAATRKGVASRFIWIASDAWGTQEKPVQQNADVAEGALTIELQSTLIPSFDRYFMSLTPSNNKRNPWFPEFWENVHNCSLSDKYQDQIDKPKCNGSERLSSATFKQETKVQFIHDAVHAIARAIDAMLNATCKTEDLCDEMRQINGKILRDYILNTTFDDGYGALVKFDEKGDAMGRYNIMNFQWNETSHSYQYSTVGSWTDRLSLDTDKIIWAGRTKETPSSRCSRPCNFNEIKFVGKDGDTCCWACIKCQEWQFLKDEFTCEDCGEAMWPNPDKRGCYRLPEQHINIVSVYALIPVFLSCIGLIVTFTVIVTFLKHNDTPVVMASGRELSYMLLSGCVLCYLVTFVLIARPSTITCAIQRAGIGLGFSVIYSSLLTKTNRISRIFDSARKSARRPPFISPKSQIVITLVLISIQVLFSIVWLVLERPGTRLYTPKNRRNEVILKCKTNDISFLVSLLYNIILIIVCTLYAIKTRKIPENFNESKFIGFAMYTTCIIWLAFVPIYFGTLNSFEVQITTLCISISLSATVALVCLFTPKMYIIVFQPEKNVRRLTMSSASYKKPATNSSSVLAANNHESSCFDSYTNERIKLNVNYDEKHGVRTVPVPVSDTNGDQDSLHSL